jgi:eukaryotic-like serine/threonine-protein kinase
LIGKSISHYRIERKLGEGGMGVVYLAEDTRLRRRVALKVLAEPAAAGQEPRNRLNLEAQAAAALNHPNICTIHEIDQHDGREFIVMEYLEGRTLDREISARPQDLRRALDIVEQVGAGLAAAHAQGIVHRDLKPANIMITSDGRAKILDFGLSLANERTRITRAGTVLGTAAYMAPEQARGEEADRRADLWSLGVVLYEMLSGTRPFRGEHDTAALHAVLYDEPAPLTSLRSGVPLELERIVTKLLEKSKEERYQHVDDLLADLRRLGRETRQTPAPAVTASAPPRQVRVSRVVAVAVVALLAAAGGYLLIARASAGRRVGGEPKPIAVIRFDNLTGDDTYDYLSLAIPNLLITSLEQSHQLRVTTWERMGDLLRQLGRPDAGEIDRDAGFAACRLDGVDIIVTGSFSQAGGTFVTDVKVLDVASKGLLASARAEGDGPDSVLKHQVDDLSSEIVRAAGVLSRAADDARRPVADVTTSSLEAYNYYLRGVRELDRHYYDDARRFFEMAVALDSTFAMAHAYLGMACGSIRDNAQRDRSYAAALRFAGKATERERLQIRARYANVIDHDGEKYEILLRELVEKYPREKAALYLLAGRCRSQGRPDEAVVLCQQALGLDRQYTPAMNELAYCYIDKGDFPRAIEYLQRYADAAPGDANPVDSMAEVYFRMGDLDHAVAAYMKAVELKPDFYPSMSCAAYVHGVKGDLDQALLWIDRYLASVPTEGLRDLGACWRSEYLFRLGRVNEALATLADQMDDGDRVPITGVYLMTAMYRLSRGEFDAAEHFLQLWEDAQARVLPEGIERIRAFHATFLALVRVREGRLEEARRVLDDVKRRLPTLPGDAYKEMQPYAQNVIDIVQAEILLANGRDDEALAAIRAAPPPQTPPMTEGPRSAHNLPLECDVAARAFAAKGDWSAASAEWARLVTFDPSRPERRIANPVYRYRLAQAYEHLGRRAEAIEQYTRFLGIWHDADPDLPELIDARARLGRLQGS